MRFFACALGLALASAFARDAVADQKRAARLFDEALADARIPSQVGVEHLHGARAAGGDLPRLEDAPHSSAAEEAPEDEVPADGRSLADAPHVGPITWAGAA